MIVDIPEGFQEEVVKVIPRAVHAMFGGSHVDVQTIRIQNVRPVIVNTPEGDSQI